MKTDDYSKTQLHEAYTEEYYARKHLESQLRNEIRNHASTRYERDIFRDDWLRYHIKENVEVSGNMEDSLDYYFNHPRREVFFTKSGGYYATVLEDNCVFIVFAWANKKQWRHESTDMLELIRNIGIYAKQPIRYTGVNNVMKNHSIDLGNGLFELRV